MKIFDVLVQRFETYLSAYRFIRSTLFLARFVLFLVTYLSEQLFLFLNRNMGSE
jgi:hypothetical protein